MERPAVGQRVGRIDFRALVIQHPPSVDAYRLTAADAAVVFAPAADHIEAFERESRRVDLRVTGRAGLYLAMLCKLLADCRSAANVGLDRCNSARRRRGR